ncbi:hypothetical protein GO755_31440 [Spirosoma sp. HMF4905]|uniref:Uncharacterized protein n=1 Tax=Spirosoma arboris TaxID=2682092 RepID=A0A7K1SLC4_9BACT|nr:hypothetical protein [Spirosoma arboris]MVM34585.1 hypothetical protein [Spirosoma arboris]
MEAYWVTKIISGGLTGVDKFGDKCAYCGCELTKGWHIDEVEATST